MTSNHCCCCRLILYPPLSSSSSSSIIKAVKYLAHKLNVDKHKYIKIEPTGYIMKCSENKHNIDEILNATHIYTLHLQ